MIGVCVERGECIHRGVILFSRFCDGEERIVIDGDRNRTYQRVWPLVMAHSNGAPFLLFEAARRFVSAHASFIRSSTVSVRECVSFWLSHKI